GEVGMFGGVEVIRDDELAPIVAGQNQVRSGLLEMSREQKASVIDFDMVRSRTARSRYADDVRVSVTIEVDVALHPSPLCRRGRSTAAVQKTPSRGPGCLRFFESA